MKTTGKSAAFIGLAATIALPMTLLSIPAQAATQDDRDDMLVWMIEEEKLAHDVYVTLGETFDVSTFDRIAASEARHQDAVRTLLDRYNLSDPTVGNPVGVFENDSIQKLYNDLVEKGTASLAAAAEVGVSIERMDIADLQEALADDQSADVDRVLNRLLNGSYQHLNAFSNLADGDSFTGSGPATGRGFRGGR